MKKLDNKKKIILGSILGIFIGALLGTTYAMFTYNSSSINNKLIAGDIYMKYKETSAINLIGAMPSATYPATATGNYFEFQITGKNTSSRDITYNVKLAYGDEETGKDRLHDNHLLFKLVEVVNNEEVTPALVNDQSYDTIPGATLYTATIPGEGASAQESTRTFRVYARIDENVVIGNTNQDYTLAEWNNSYASVKINVDGGFTGGNNQATPANCFSTSDNGDGTLTITGYNGSCGGNVVIPSQIDVSVNPSQSSNKKNNDNLTQMPNVVENNNNIVKRTDNNNLKTVTAIGNSAFKCYNGLCGNFEGSIFVDDANAETSMEYFGGTSYSTGDGDIVILDNDLDSIVNTLVIPDTVVTIGHSAFYKNNITTLVIPDSVETIGTLAFFKCSISNLDLGNGVQTIGYDAFMSNSITSLTLPSSLTYAEMAFLDNSITNLIFNSFNYENLGSIFTGSISDPIGFPDQGNVSITLNMTEIPSYFLYNYDDILNNITFNVTLANNVSSIDSYAFGSLNISFNRSCEQLESMENYPWSAKHLYGNGVQCYSED